MMVFRLARILFIALLALPCAKHCCYAQTRPEPFEEFRQLLTQIAPASPDVSGSPNIANDDALKTASSIFDHTASIATDALNADTSSQARMTEVLKKLEAISNAINVAWPEENRLHTQIFDLPPMLVLKVTIRSQARFFVFAVPEKTSNNSKVNRLWRQVGSDDVSFEHPAPYSWLDIYPLQRALSGKARFLARIGYSGCAGSSGLVYEVYEWNPNYGGILEQTLNQVGSAGMDEVFDGHKPTAKDSFAPVGVLRTTGPTITLPYCWFSAIDYWDNPSLCAVDTYDLSGEEIIFRSRVYNRPDLVPIAKAVEYAEKRDYPAVLGYCASSRVARRMVRRRLSFTFDEARVICIRKGKERVEFSDPPDLIFEVERHGDRWVVASFRDR